MTESPSTVVTPRPVSIDAALAGLRFLPDRTPGSEAEGWFAVLSDYRDGAMFVASYAGRSEWERHRSGDEIVLVLEGATTLILLVDGEEISHALARHEFLIVPRGVWHRFETPEAVTVMSVTPQPTDHTVERPPSGSDESAGAS